MIQKSDKYVNDIKFRGNSIGRIYKDGEVYWGGDTPAPSPVKNYMKTTIANNDGTTGNITFRIGSTISTSDYASISYSTDGTNWTTINNVDDEFIMHDTQRYPNGTVIYWKGEGIKPGHELTQSGLYFYSLTASFDVSGDIRSLIYGDRFDEVSIDTPYPSNYTFANIFHGSNVKHAHELLLPNTVLTTGCYAGMFGGCQYLTSAPTLPATTLAPYCYASMFSVCKSLTKAPALPAMTLAESCYRGMFYSSGLNTAPIISATAYANYSCYEMFRSCASLLSCPDLSATTLAKECCRYMFNNCISLITAPALPATTLAEYCYANMFRNCSSLTTAPELPALTLVTHCYRGMLQGCNNLNYIKAMFTTTPGANYTASWTSSVSSTGTFVKNINATWTNTGINGVPTGWTIETASE